MARSRKPKLLWIVGVMVLTAAGVLIVLNLTASEKRVEQPIPHSYAVSDSQFSRSMGVLLGPALEDGNRVSALINGVEIFPAMLSAIRAARQTITFETYIYWSGEIGREFADALAERARAGVKVHVLLDWLGTGKMEEVQVERMRQAGVQVVKYHPLRWYNLDRLNNRTHRKLLVIDGHVGFTGGVGIADEWQGDAQSPEHWRDSHFQVEGPVVAQMQAGFMDNWLETRGMLLDGKEYFPDLDPVGPHLAQLFQSSSGDGSQSVRLMYLLSIAAAARSIRLSNAYFVPDELSIEMLIAAQRRGVRVEIIVPGRHIDFSIVRRASRALWGPLLQAGVAIYEYQPTMYHTKVMIVDDQWVSVGSTNFDNRSFRLNDEANLNILDGGFARSQARVFERDRSRARRITFQMWQDRPWSEKAREWLASLVSSQL